jgi:Tripartite tricarboxylate transporter TctB family
MNGPRSRHLGELALDLAIVIGSALYVRAAGHYPPQGRQIPILVGWIALGLGVLHLVGHVVPGLWKLTHGAETRRATSVVVPQSAVTGVAEAARAAQTRATEEAADESDPTGDPAAAPAAGEPSHGDPRQVLVGIAWVVGLLVGIYVLGFAIAVPVFFLAYFGVMRAWRTAVISAVVMGAVTQGLFVEALAVPLPTGWLGLM